MNVKIEDSWKKALGEEFEKDYFRTLVDFVKREYASSQVFPPGNEIFAAFDATPFDRVKVVILGQDPYHGEHQANGLCFSVNDGIPFPPSLLNIFKEIKADIGTEIPSSGNLERWARQGVLLLNATLTVRAHEAASHQGYAIKKGAFIDRSRHLVLTSPHPSPLSAHRGFFGNHHFSQANAYLSQHGETPINW